jgi:hypothetical protein
VRDALAGKHDIASKISGGNPREATVTAHAAPKDYRRHESRCCAVTQDDSPLAQEGLSRHEERGITFLTVDTTKSEDTSVL